MKVGVKAGQDIHVRFNGSYSVRVLIVLLLGMAPAFAQLTLGDNTKMNMTANSSMGYSHTSGTDLPTTSSLDLSFDGNLNGYYYNPSFLSFRANPYYDRSRTNSGSTSIFGAKGFDSSLSLFSGGRTPIGFGYSRSYDNEQLLNVPGSLANYVARGSGQSLSLSGGLLFEGLPTLNLGFGETSSTSTSIGAVGQTKGAGTSRNFSLNSSYHLLGFSLNGGYTNTHSQQSVPDIVSGSGFVHTNTSQKSQYVSATRSFGPSTNLSTNFTRSTFSGDGGGGSQSQATFDTFLTNLSMRPTQKLSTNYFFDYTTNYGAYLLERALSNNGSSVLISNLTSNSSSYMDYGASAGYAFTQRLSATGMATIRRSTAQGLSGDSKILTSGLSYGRPLFGGNFGVHGSISRATAGFQARSQEQTGESMGVSSGRRLFGWELNGGLQYQRNSMVSSTLPVTQSGYSWTFGTSHKVTGSWRLNASATDSHNRIDQLGGSDSGARSYALAFSGRKVDFGSSYSKSDGTSILTATGLVPVGGGDVLPGTSLILFSGSSYALTATFHPMRKLNISGDYSHALYSTQSPITSSSGLLDRYDARAEYYLRRMHISAGYSHLGQGFGALLHRPVSTNAFSIGISRSFDIF
jgi:hypothetical protein